MGPKQSNSYQQQQEFFSQYEVIQEIPSENVRFLEHKKTKKQYLLRQLSYNDRKEYLKTIETIKTKKQQLKGAQHVTHLEEYFQKQEDQYCSTFFKIYVLFEYPQRTLDDEITERNVDKKSFAESELWSILASCILGLSHLQRKGIRHSALKSSTIFLSPEGHIKISDPFASGCTSNYETLLNKRNSRHIYLSPQQCEALQNEEISPNVNPFKSDIFTLGMVLLECGLLFYQDDCYRDENSRIHWETLEYKKNIFRRSYSEELVNMVEYMLGPEAESRPEWTELESLVIMDSMGKSFISDGRQSIIVAPNSKPASVNTLNVGQQMHRNYMESAVLENNNPQSHLPLRGSSASRGIGVSSNKPVSVPKGLQYEQQPFTAVNFSPAPVVGAAVKPKSTTHLPPFYSSNVLSSSSQYDLHKPNPYSSSVYGHSDKRYDISPLAPSNISHTRPLKSFFPSPFFEFATKADENLVEVGDSDGATSRSVSETSQYRQTQASQNYNSGYSYQNNPTNDYQNYPSGSYHSVGDQGSPHSKYSIANENSQFQCQSHFQKKKEDGEFVVETFKLGSRYEGFKKNGLRNGEGKFYYQDGGMYDGSWYNNKMQGFGKLFYQSGKIAYEGDWVADQFTGKGILYNQRPDQIEGGFDFRNFDEVDELWTRYEGEFVEDLKHGHGILYLSNGEFFEGNFEADAAQGEGVFTNLQGQRVKGTWDNNILVEQTPNELI